VLNQLSRHARVVRDTHAMFTNPLGYLDRARARGDAVPVELAAGWRFLLLNHPEDIEHVLVHNRQFPKRHPFLKEMKRLIGEGLATSDGELWRRQRRAVQQALGREQIAAYADDMADASRKLADGFRPGEVRDLHRDFMGLILAGTARAFFSAEVAGDTREFIDCISVVMERFSSPFFMFAPALDRLPLPSVRRLADAQRRLQALIDRVILERRAGAAGNDMLSALAAESAGDASPAARRQLRDEVTTLVIAGYEPTAVALAWTFHLLLQHPARLEAAVEEARHVVARGAAATADEAARLPLIRAAIDEALRMYPPAWTSVREAEEPHEFRGHTVPQGGLLWFSPWVVHRDPRWYDRPEEFRPERWADGLAKRLPRGAYFPYGAGPRMCIGAGMASAQMPRIVATMLARWRFERVPGRDPGVDPGINLRPKRGVWARIVGE
jgi:cytochrome P450